MAKKAFSLSSYIRHNPETGGVEIDLIPDRKSVELTGQQIVDAVVELVIWHWNHTPLEAYEDSDFDS